ncbi:hypothetical protein PCE1_004983 [Barthelona sp. PCE]
MNPFFDEEDDDFESLPSNTPRQDITADELIGSSFMSSNTGLVGSNLGPISGGISENGFEEEEEEEDFEIPSDLPDRVPDSVIKSMLPEMDERKSVELDINSVTSSFDDFEDDNAGQPVHIPSRSLANALNDLDDTVEHTPAFNTVSEMTSELSSVNGSNVNEDSDYEYHEYLDATQDLSDMDASPERNRGASRTSNANSITPEPFDDDYSVEDFNEEEAVEHVIEDEESQVKHLQMSQGLVAPVYDPGFMYHVEPKLSYDLDSILKEHGLVRPRRPVTKKASRVRSRSRTDRLRKTHTEFFQKENFYMNETKSRRRTKAKPMRARKDEEEIRDLINNPIRVRPKTVMDSTEGIDSRMSLPDIYSSDRTVSSRRKSTSRKDVPFNTRVTHDPSLLVYDSLLDEHNQWVKSNTFQKTITKTRNLSTLEKNVLNLRTKSRKKKERKRKKKERVLVLDLSGLTPFTDAEKTIDGAIEKGFGHCIETIRQCWLALSFPKSDERFERVSALFQEEESLELLQQLAMETSFWTHKFNKVCNLVKMVVEESRPLKGVLLRLSKELPWIKKVQIEGAVYKICFIASKKKNEEKRLLSNVIETAKAPRKLLARKIVPVYKLKGRRPLRK